MKVNGCLSNNQKLNGKVTIITGVSGGIGKEIAKLFMAQGSKVIGLSRNIEEQFCNEIMNEIDIEDDISKYFLPVKCDVTKENDVIQAIQKAVSLFGGIDILVNNAGITNRFSVKDLGLSDWEKVIKVNLTGSFLVSHYAIPYMIQKRSGNIVFISSIGAYVSWESDASYQASKGGIVSLSRSIAIDCALHNIRVNCVCPGLINAPMLTDYLRENDSENLILNKFINRIPLKRLGSPQEVANAVLFLASDDSSYITGTTLVVDGGYMVYDF